MVSIVVFQLFPTTYFCKLFQIKFVDFDLEEHSNCKYDSVSIYDGRSKRHLLGKYCYKLNIQPLVAHSGAMKVVFLSDQHNSGRLVLKAILKD